MRAIRLRRLHSLRLPPRQSNGLLLLLLLLCILSRSHSHSRLVSSIYKHTRVGLLAPPMQRYARAPPPFKCVPAIYVFMSLQAGGPACSMAGYFMQTCLLFMDHQDTWRRRRRSNTRRFHEANKALALFAWPQPQPQPKSRTCLSGRADLLLLLLCPAADHHQSESPAGQTNRQQFVFMVRVGVVVYLHATWRLAFLLRS